MKKLNYNKPIEIAKGVFWIGYNFKSLWFHTNPYLIVEGDEAALIDPGSLLDFKIVLNKVKSLCDIKNLNYIVLQHQDPDLCGSTSEFEKVTKISCYMPERSYVFAQFYGIKSFVFPIKSDNDEIRFKTGRKLKFFMTPYCHSPGAMVTYDEENKILFSSDIFGAFNMQWELYADIIGHNKYLQSVKRFMEPFMGSRRAILNFIQKAKKLNIQQICPQHGSIIRKDIPKWIDELKNMDYGSAIDKGKTGLEFDLL